MNAEQKLLLLSKEKKTLKRKLKKTKKWLLILGIPYAIPLLPILLPLYLLKRKNKKIKLKNNIVNRLFSIHQFSAPDALNHIKKNNHLTPPGTEALFKSMSCEKDEDWLEWFNTFLEQQKIPTIFLTESGQNRFQKIRFSSNPTISSDIKISVIMPAYNSEATIEVAIQSILNQTWKNLELLVIDDCSTDKTLHIVSQLAEQDSRLRVIHNAVNTGPYVAKNRALSFSTGDYITGHDADDIALPNRLQKQVEPILSEANCEATLGFMIRLDENALFSSASPIGKTSFNGICLLAYISLMLPRSTLIDQLGFWDTVRFGADSEMIARVQSLLGDRLKRLDTVTMLCLDHPSGLTNDTEHGIKTVCGLSDSRKNYKTNWQNWHIKTSADNRHLPFPHIQNRKFEAPTSMHVSSEALTTEAKELTGNSS